MLQIKTTATADEAVVQALKEIAVGDPEAPLSLNDHLTKVGLRDPYQRALALRLLRLRLKPGGTHWDLTKEKRWAFEREPWAKAAGLTKGRQELTFNAETSTTRSLSEVIEQSEHLPETARDAVGHIRTLLATRPIESWTRRLRPWWGRASRTLYTNWKCRVGFSRKRLWHRTGRASQRAAAATE